MDTTHKVKKEVLLYLIDLAEIIEIASGERLRDSDYLDALKKIDAVTRYVNNQKD